MARRAPEADDVRSLTPSDALAAEQLLDGVLGSRHQARLGELVDVLALPGFGAWLDGNLAGVATYSFDAGTRRAELAALGVEERCRNRGLGGALVETVALAAASMGASTVWLVTTNDNLEALRLYQRHGFRLAALHANALDSARRLKPSIPAIGRFGIPLRDELVLERELAN